MLLKLIADGGTITFADTIANGTITLDGEELVINKSVTIDGENKITIDGNNESRVFLIDDGTGTFLDVTLEGLTIQNGTSNGGGGIFNQENLTLSNSTLSSNEATFSGGGIYNREGTATLTSTSVSGNTATNNGDEVFNNFGIINADANNLFGDDSKSKSEAFSSFTPSGSDITATSDGTNPTALSNILEVDGEGKPFLKDNGGDTLTIALVPNSPAIDAGDNNNLTTDQRGTGFDRLIGNGVDIGAFELLVNQAPVISNEITDFTVLENADNSTFDLTDVFSDREDNDGDLTFTVESNDNETLVNASIDNTTDILTLDFLADQSGTATITVSATDSGNLSVSETFTVTVSTVSNFDIDGDGQYLAAVDGLLFYGYLNIRNLPSEDLVNNLTQQLADNLINPDGGATRKTGAEIAQYLENNQEMLDIDGDGSISASIDGLLTYGYFNIRNLPSQDLVNNLTQQLADNLIPSGGDADRTSGVDIANFIESYIT